MKCRETFRKCFASTLCVALVLGCCISQPDFLGPGISDAVAHATDRTDSTMDGEAELQEQIALRSVASTSQVFNYLGVIRSKSVILQQVDLTVSLNTNNCPYTEWFAYDYTDIENLSFSAASHPETDGKIEMSFWKTVGIPTNTAIGFCYFNSEDNFPLAQASITAAVSYAKDRLGNEYTANNNLISFELLKIGDVDLDGRIDAIDAMRASQIAVHSIEYTQNQWLAADVNCNGVVDAVDSLMIQKYSVGTIAGFWGDTRYRLPTTPPTSVVNNLVYRIRNASTEQYLRRSGGGVGVTTGYNPRELNSKFKIVRVAGTGYFKIQYYDTLSDLRLTSSYQLTLATTGTLANSQYWYFIPTDGGYYIVNKALPLRSLTDFGAAGNGCKPDYALRGMVWELVKPQVTLSYFYDSNYNSRRGATGRNEISANQEKTATILENVFHADVTTVPLSYVTTRADSCTAGINAHCTCFTNTQCLAKCDDYYTFDFAQVHHKNSEALLLQWYKVLYNIVPNEDEPAPANPTCTVHLLHSGLYQCHNANGVHKRNGIGGQMWTPYGVGAVYCRSAATAEVTEKLHALHEISHQIGVSTSYNSSLQVDDNHPDNVCVMSYYNHDVDLLRFFNSPSASDHEDLYCTACFNAITDCLAKRY